MEKLKTDQEALDYFAGYASRKVLTYNVQNFYISWDWVNFVKMLHNIHKNV